jgi:hypothetical protein
MAPDEARPARDQDLHRSTSPEGRATDAEPCRRQAGDEDGPAGEIREFVVIVLWVLHGVGSRREITMKCPQSGSVSRILFPPAGLAARRRVAIIPLAPRLPAGSSNLPGGFSRASLERPPIWSCSVWGFPCPSCHHDGGALLPHLFTLATPGRPGVRRCVFCGTFPEVTLAGR